MSWTFTDNLAEFREAAEPLLRTRPIANTIALTVIAELRAVGMGGYDDVFLGWWTGATDTSASAAPSGPMRGAVRGAVIHTLPFHLLLAELPVSAITPLARDLHARGRQLPGASGTPEIARAFAAAWCARTRASARVEREERLYALQRLVPPDPMPAGTARVACDADRELLIRWMDGFDAEIGIGVDNAGFVAERLAYGGLTLWERVGGEPVSMAGVARPGAGVVRVGPVYTPREYRGRGYGQAVTAAVTRAALEAGAASVVLYTDLANPTSNAIYQRIGYRPVEDRLVVAFTQPPSRKTSWPPVTGALRSRT